MLVLTYIAFGCYFCAHKKHSSNGQQHFAPTCPSPVSNLIYLKEQNTQINPSIIKANREPLLIPSRQSCEKLCSMEFSLLHAPPPSVLTEKESIPETVSLSFLLHHAAGLHKTFFLFFFKLTYHSPPSVYLLFSYETMTDGQWDKYCPYDHIQSHDSATQALSEFPLPWDLMAFHPLCWHYSRFTLI